MEAFSATVDKEIVSDGERLTQNSNSKTALLSRFLLVDIDMFQKLY